MAMMHDPTYIGRLEDELLKWKSRALRAEGLNRIIYSTVFGIAHANYKDWEPGYDNPEEFIRWVKSRCGHILEKMKDVR